VDLKTIAKLCRGGYLSMKVEPLCRVAGTFRVAPASAIEGKRDEFVRHFRDQLHAIDSDITVFDPKEVQAKPTEDGGTAGSPLH
jgi:hypothetical protein